MTSQQRVQRERKEHYFKLQMEEEMLKLKITPKKMKVVENLLMYAYRKGVSVCVTKSDTVG